jgi:biotin carboxylase
MSRTWTVFIESNTTGTGRTFVGAASALGHKPVVLAADPDRYPYLQADRIDFVAADTHNIRSVLKVCQRLAQRAPIAGITSSSEYFIALAATVARRLGLPGPEPNAIRRSRNKLHQRRRLQNTGIGIPRFFAARSVSAAVSSARRLGLPVVVKPVAESGSLGVLLCATIEEVAAHARSLLSRTLNERGLPGIRVILVEEYVVGREYSVETLNGEIVGITQKHLGCLPYFVEVGHDYPAVLARPTEAFLRQYVMRVLSVLGLTWGPAHIEVRSAANEVKMIEANPRLAGGYIPELVRLASGRDLIAETIALVTGQDRQPACAGLGFASIRFLTAPRGGRLTLIKGLAAARQIPTVVDVRMYRSVGDSVRLCGDFRDRIGHVIAADGESEETRRAAEAARRAVKVVVENVARSQYGPQ